MIQILGLRTYKGDDGKIRTTEKFFEKGWRCESVFKLFATAHEIINTIPEEERWNIYYTVANCFERKGRQLEFQEAIPFDIDGTEPAEHNAVIDIFCDALSVNRDEIGIVASGNGLQFIVGLTSPITSEEFFEENKIHYKMIAGKINQAMFIAGLSGSVDTSVFSAARLMRFPFTKNKKKDKGEKFASMVNSRVIPLNIDLAVISGAGTYSEEEHIPQDIFSRYPIPDPAGVQEGCDFLKFVKNNQDEVSEPQWYAALSIIGRLDEGRTRAHDYSKLHRGYSEKETDAKLEHSLRSSGPRTCENISSLWSGCPSCPNFRRCKSPITIKSDGYIATKATGFYETATDPTTGLPKKTKISFSDLMLYFRELHQFVVHRESGSISVFKKTQWDDITDNEVNSFCESHVNPKPKGRDCAEFLGKLKRNFMVSSEFFTPKGKVNLRNGVLDFTSEELLSHNEKYGFKYTLPFDYDPKALCPHFDRFLEDVTLGDTEIQEVLMEFIGATMAGAPSSKVQKALILTGDGSNGKSVFVDIIKALCGKGNYAALSMGKEIEKMENRYSIDGKLCNISEENPINALKDSTIFKAIVTGSEITARRLYANTYEMVPAAKVIMLCNSLPETNDGSYGMLRRLLIIPFDAVFKHEMGNIDVDIREKMLPELSGIFNRAMIAFKNLEARKYRFTESKVILAANNNYMEDNKSLEKIFIEECLLFTQKEERCAEVYDTYRKWAMISGVSENRIKDSTRFSRSLTGSVKGIKRDRKHDGRFFTGVTIRPEWKNKAINKGDF